MKQRLFTTCLLSGLFAESTAFAQSPRYVASICWMEMFNGVSHVTDTDWLSLFMKAPTDERTYAAGPRDFKKGDASARQNWQMVSEPVPVPNDDQTSLTMSWSVGNIGTSDKQAGGKAVSDKAEEIGMSTGNPYAIAISYVAGTIVGYLLQDCDINLFQQRVVIDGASLARGLSSPWVSKGKDRWYQVFDYNHIKGSCDEAHYNLEVYIRKVDDGGNVNAPEVFAGDQLNRLYVPLDVLLEEGDAEWLQFTKDFNKQFGRPIPLKVETVKNSAAQEYTRVLPLPDPEWEVWMNAVFTKFKPRNDKISEVIHDNAAYYDGGQIPPCFKEWLAYQEDFNKAYNQATLEPTKRIWNSSLNFPTCLVPYVSNTRKKLEQSHIAKVAATAPPTKAVDECDPDPSHFQ